MDVMNRRSSLCQSAIATYTILAILPLGVIWVWLLSLPRLSFSEALSPPGAISLFIILAGLFVGSIVEVLALIAHASEQKAILLALLVLGVALVGLAWLWSAIAAILYLIGFGCLWAVYRQANQPAR